MMQNINEFSDRCWYGTKMVIIKWADADTVMRSCPQDLLAALKENAVYVGTPHELRSETHKEIRELILESYGVVDDHLIVEVH